MKLNTRVGFSKLFVVSKNTLAIQCLEKSHSISSEVSKACDCLQQICLSITKFVHRLPKNQVLINVSYVPMVMKSTPGVNFNYRLLNWPQLYFLYYLDINYLYPSFRVEFIGSAQLCNTFKTLFLSFILLGNSFSPPPWSRPPLPLHLSSPAASLARANRRRMPDMWKSGKVYKQENICWIFIIQWEPLNVIAD